jgi:hypothetical protein
MRSRFPWGVGPCVGRGMSNQLRHGGRVRRGSRAFRLGKRKGGSSIQRVGHVVREQAACEARLWKGTEPAGLGRRVSCVVPTLKRRPVRGAWREGKEGSKPIPWLKRWAVWLGAPGLRVAVAVGGAEPSGSGNGRDDEL